MALVLSGCSHFYVGTGRWRRDIEARHERNVAQLRLELELPKTELRHGERIHVRVIVHNDGPAPVSVCTMDRVSFMLEKPDGRLMLPLLAHGWPTHNPCPDELNLASGERRVYEENVAIPAIAPLGAARLAASKALAYRDEACGMGCPQRSLRGAQPIVISARE